MIFCKSFLCRKAFSWPMRIHVQSYLDLCKVVILLSGFIFFERPWFELAYMERRRGWIDGVAGFHVLMHSGLSQLSQQFCQRYLSLWSVVIPIASVDIGRRSIKDLRASFQEQGMKYMGQWMEDTNGRSSGNIPWSSKWSNGQKKLLSEFCCPSLSRSLSPPLPTALTNITFL